MDIQLSPTHRQTSGSASILLVLWPNVHIHTSYIQYICLYSPTAVMLIFQNVEKWYSVRCYLHITNFICCLMLFPFAADCYDDRRKAELRYMESFWKQISRSDISFVSCEPSAFVCNIIEYTYLRTCVRVKWDKMPLAIVLAATAAAATATIMTGWLVICNGQMLLRNWIWPAAACHK